MNLETVNKTTYVAEFQVSYGVLMGVASNVSIQNITSTVALQQFAYYYTMAGHMFGIVPNNTNVYVNNTNLQGSNTDTNYVDAYIQWYPYSGSGGYYSCHTFVGSGKYLTGVVGEIFQNSTFSFNSSTLSFTVSNPDYTFGITTNIAQNSTMFLNNTVMSSISVSGWNASLGIYGMTSSTLVAANFSITGTSSVTNGSVLISTSDSNNITLINCSLMVSVSAFTSVGIIQTDTSSSISVANTSFTFIINSGAGYQGFIAAGTNSTI
jgi:hypothetical protein